MLSIKYNHQLCTCCILPLLVAASVFSVEAPDPIPAPAPDPAPDPAAGGRAAGGSAGGRAAGGPPKDPPGPLAIKWEPRDNGAASGGTRTTPYRTWRGR